MKWSALAVVTLLIAATQAQRLMEGRMVPASHAQSTAVSGKNKSLFSKAVKGVVSSLQWGAQVGQAHAHHALSTPVPVGPAVPGQDTKALLSKGINRVVKSLRSKPKSSHAMNKAVEREEDEEDEDEQVSAGPDQASGDRR